MKQIKYIIEIKAVNHKGQEIKIETHASNSAELFQNINEILNKKSKNWIEKLLSLE